MHIFDLSIFLCYNYVILNMKGCVYMARRRNGSRSGKKGHRYNVTSWDKDLERKLKKEWERKHQPKQQSKSAK